MSKSLINEVQISIKRLGAIRDSVVQLNRLMIISGESGVGKSYLAVVCNYIFHLLSSDFRLEQVLKGVFPSLNDMRKGMGESGVAFEISKIDFETFINQDVIKYLRYIFNAEDLVGEISFSLPIPDKIICNYRKESSEINNEIVPFIVLDINGLLKYRIKDEDESTIGESNFVFLLRVYLINLLFGSFRDFRYNFILPPSRGALLTEDVTARSGLYREFSEMMMKINVSNPDTSTPNQFLSSAFSLILGGDVYKDSNSDRYLYSTNQDNVTMPLSAAAASVRELAPLSLYVNKFDVSKTCFFIEEPEAHLHPLKQRMMADLISLLVHEGSYIQITSHSDYLITRLNELIQAGSILNGDDEHAKEALMKGIDDVNGLLPLLLERESVSAYLLKRQEDGFVSISIEMDEMGLNMSSFYQALKDGLKYRQLFRSIE